MFRLPFRFIIGVALFTVLFLSYDGINADSVPSLSQQSAVLGASPSSSHDAYHSYFVAYKI